MPKFTSYPAMYRSDIRLFLVLIPCINILTYYLTYSPIRFAWRTLITFTIDTVEGYIAWMAVRLIIMYLEQKLPYEQGPLRRIIVQLLLTTFSGMLIIIALTEMVNYIATDTPVPVSFYTQDIFIISIWFFVINGIYVGLYYYYAWQHAEQRREEENRLKTTGFMARLGKQEVLLPFEDIGCFFVDGDYATVCTLAGKKYLLDQSLDKVEKSLPYMAFFRINRQCIMHRQLITGFERAENGKLSVLTKGAVQIPGQLVVSRTKAPQFKTWFQPA